MATRPFAPLARNAFILRHAIFSRRYNHDTAPAAAKQVSRMHRLNARLPRFLRKYTTPLISAPVTHVSAFLILHELTAIVPLFGLAGLFHYTQWLPPFISEWQWFSEGMRRFGNYFRKKGWLKEEADEAEGPSTWAKRFKSWWTHGETGSRLVAEVAAAWALTKLLMPLRLIISVWATPLFARVFVAPPMRLLARMFRRAPAASAATAQKAAPGAGTNAVGGGVVPPRNAKP